MTKHIVLDLSEQMYFYRKTAPSLLINYIDFHDFVSLLVNTESTPYYDELILESIYSIINDKLPTDAYIHSYDFLDIEVYMERFISYIDNHIDIAIKNILRTDEYMNFYISRWIDNRTPIVSVELIDHD